MCRLTQPLVDGRAHWRCLLPFVATALCLLAACREELHGQLSEPNANEILDALYEAGIAAGKRSDDGRSWVIEVEADALQRALRVTLERGLPRQHFASTGELFKKEGLVSTPSEERIRYIFSVSQELANTLSQIDGVVSARVHPVIPENDPLVEKVRPASASVFIKHRREANLQAMAPAIKNLVMRGIEGLSYDNIALTFVSAEGVPPAASPVLPQRDPRWLYGVLGMLTVMLAVVLAALGQSRQQLRRMTAKPSPTGGGVLHAWWRRRATPPAPAVHPAASASSNEGRYAAKPGGEVR